MAEIYVGNRDSNFQMVQFGAAYAYRQYLKQCDRDNYLRAEATAAKKGLGVWGPYKPAQAPWEFLVHVVVDMIRLLIPLSLGLAFMAPIPASAAVLAEGKISNGYYWQKTASKSGSIRYIFRSTSAGKFQKHQKCKDARAVKPK